MKTLSKWVVVGCLVAGPVSAADYQCSGNRVEKAGNTQYTVRMSGSDITIEKGGNSRGKAVKRGDWYAIEVRGNTQATVERGRIYKSGSSWSSVSDAQRIYNCPDIVAATLWVLNQQGEL